MEVIVSNKSFKINPDDIGGVLSWLKEDDMNSVPLPIKSHIDFDIFLHTKDCSELSTHQIVSAFKIAHYLNSQAKMELFGRALAKRIESSSYEEIRDISKYFE